MMMMRHSTRRRRITSTLPFIGVVVAFFIMVLFHTPLQGLVVSVLGLFEENNASYALLSRQELVERLDSAETELRRVYYQRYLYERAVGEEVRLKTFMGMRSPQAYGAGVVVAAPPRTGYDTLLISTPEGEVVRVGDEVHYDGFVLGTVSAVGDSFAQVTLYSTPGVVTDARVGEPSAIVSLQGKGGGSFSFEIPSESTLLPGTLITTVDGARVLGIVSSIERSPDRTTALVFAHLPVSAHTIRFVDFVRSGVSIETLP